MKRAISLLAFALSGLGLANAQWSDDPAENLQLNNESFYSFETELLSDGSWYLYYNRPDGSIDTIVPYLQRYDKDGNAMWAEPLEISRNVTMSWTKVMDCMTIDQDDNAIIVTQDLRHGPESYTAYKISPDGESLWPEGVDLHNGNYPGGCAALNMTQIADGSYIFAWLEYTNDDANTGVIRMQRVSAEGEILWGEGKLLQEENTPMTYPYVLDAGNNEFLLVYAYGASQQLQVRKMDFDGNDVWAQPTTAFDAVSSSIPLWTFLEVIPADGGVLIATYEGDPNFPYIAYVKNDGTHAFAEGSAGLRLGYSEWLAWGIKLVFDEENQAIYATWRESDYNQQYYQIVTQKVSLDGELLWDPNGIAITPFLPRPVSYYDAELGPKGSLFVTFMEQYDVDGNGLGSNDPVNVLAALQDPDGGFMWADTTVTVSNHVGVKYSTESLPLSNDQWIVVWEDCRADSIVHGDSVLYVESRVDGGWIYGQSIGMDGNLGGGMANETNEESLASNRVSVFQIYPNPVRESATLVIENGSNPVQISIELLDIRGTAITKVYDGTLPSGKTEIGWTRPAGLAQGLYIMRCVIGRQVYYIKVMLQ